MSASTMTVLARLKAHAETLAGTRISELFEADPARFAHTSVLLDDMLVDPSRTLTAPHTWALLQELAEVADLPAWREKMFSGQPINATEGRAVLHTALRNFSGRPVLVDGVDVMPDVMAVLDAMKVFVDGVRGGTIVAADGGLFTDVVNIGIGGSDLGPAMATIALSPYRGRGPRVHYVSNVDGAHVADTLADLDPARTLILVASKTFTTLETMTNARSARDWIVAALGEAAVTPHFAAISTALERCAAFGIAPDRIFGFWDWVGGRYSVWSAIGLSVALSIGFDNFRAFLQGGHEMDEHFRTAPLVKNIPVVLALLGIWHRNVLGYATHAVLPYDQRLSRFAAHLQQLDMESNGKRVTREGLPVEMPTGPVVWGEPGTNGQHAFFQLIHQGTDPVPADFLIAAVPHEQLSDHHAKLIANCLAQGEALMVGKSEAEVRTELASKGMAPAAIDALAPHKEFPGDRPSTTIAYKTLNPRTLGRLLAAYEHKVFVQGVIWDINSFDQWGVELGKELATALLPAVEGKAEPKASASTTGILAHLRALAGA